MKKGHYIRLVTLCCLLFFSIIFAISVGSANISMVDSLRIVVGKIPVLKEFVDLENLQEVYEIIIWKVRLPRVILASLVGGGLGAVGCTFQAIFRNSLADPHILGVSSGATLGATVAILSGISLSFLGMGVTSLFALIGALITVVVVYQIGGRVSRIEITNLLLVGTAISTMLSATISLLMIYNREQLEKVYLWTLGSFNSANWSKVLFLGVLSLLVMCVLVTFTRELNVLLSGDEIAESLGIDTRVVKKMIILLAAVFVAACVSVSGTIGFVGLIIPHCMRLLVGSNHRYLLPFSYLGGGIFMVLCDTIARTIAAPTEIPVGVITAVIGGPYFIFLLYKNKKKKSI